MSNVDWNRLRMHYILNGHEIVEEPDTLTWAKWFETANRTVEQTKVCGFLVSTVFLGLDHNWSSERLPILFETMIFEDNERHSTAFEDYQERYCTWDEAVVGHHAAVRMVKNAKDN